MPVPSESAESAPISAARPYRPTDAGPLWSQAGQMTIPGLLAEAVRQWPDRTFLEFGDVSYSFAAFDREADRLARGLEAQGVVKGATVTTMLDNSDDAVLIWFAINKLGAIAVPLNTALKGGFLSHQINDAGSALLIAEAHYIPRVTAIRSELPSLRTIIARGGQGDEFPDFSLLRTCGDEPVESRVEPGDIALIIYTSGTTGPSKGCALPHGYVLTMSGRVREATDRRQDDVVLSPLPLFHIAATTNLILASMMVGARSVLLERFSLGRFWCEVEASGATQVNLMGSMIALIAHAPDSDVAARCFGQVRCALGVPFPPPIETIWRERFGTAIVGNHAFGMTEAAPVAYRRIGRERPGTSGILSPDFDARVVDDRGEECPPGVPGELLLRPVRPNVMFTGYWGRPVETMAVFGDLWFHSGDIVSIDADGYLTFVDRKKDYLRRGGENISSFEIEAVFRAHPAIEDVAVHAVPSEVSEDELKVVAIPRDGMTVDAEELCRWSIERVPYYAVPRFIEFRTELPRTPTGRVMKHRLRAEGITAATWDRASSSIVIEKR